MIGIGGLSAFAILLLGGLAVWLLMEGRVTMLRALRGLYVLLLAGFVIMFVVFGVMALYPGPKAPEFPRREPPPSVATSPPVAPVPEGKAETPSPEVQKFREEQQKAQQEYEQERRVFEQAEKAHRRNVFFIAFPLSVLAVALGLLLPGRLDVFRPGFALGGAGLVIYAVAQSQGTVGNLAAFLAVGVGLAVLVFLGYRQLVQKRAPEP